MVSNIFVLDKNLRTKMALSVNGRNTFFSDTYNMNLSTGTESYEFSTNVEGIDESDYIMFHYHDQYKLFQITEIEQDHEEGKIITTVYGECASLELINGAVRPLAETVEMNAIEFIDMVLEGSEWQIHKYSKSLLDKKIPVKIDKTTQRWQLIQDYMGSFGYEINTHVKYANGFVKAKFIDVYAEGDLGNRTYKRFEYGRNVKGITKKKDIYDFCTALILDTKQDVKGAEYNIGGYTKAKDDDVIYATNENKKYNAGRQYIYGVYEDNNSETPGEVVENALAELKKRAVPHFDYECDTALTYAEYEDINIGDTVYVIDHSFTPMVTLEARVGELEISFTDRDNCKCNLTNYKEIRSKIDVKLTAGINDIIKTYFPLGSYYIADGAITNGKIDTKYYQEIKADMVSASYAEFGKLAAEEIVALQIYADQIVANHGRFEDLTVNRFEAAEADIGTLDAEVANIETLINGSTVSGNIQTIVLNAQNTTIEDALIKNAMIDKLDADKIKSGTLNTNFVDIQGPSGNMLIKDNTIQIKDNHTDEKGNPTPRTRIQIGKDASDDYNMYVWDKNGKLMFDASGLTADGVQRPIIRDDMVQEGANISGAKINMSSLFKTMNESGETLKSTAVYLDDEEQTLDVSFKNMHTKVDGNFDSLTTKLNVTNGRIDTLINEKKETDESVTTQFSQMSQSLDNISTNLGKLTTTVTENEKDIEQKVAAQTTSFNQSLEGFRTEVNSTYATKASLKDAEDKAAEDLSSTTETLNSKIDQTATSIKSEVAETYATNGYVSSEVSRLEQKSDSLQISFKCTGGNNLLRNSAFKNGTTGWSALRWDTTAGGTNNMHVVYDGGEWTPKGKNSLSAYVVDVYENVNNVPLRAGFDSDKFNVTEGRKYTLGCYIAAHRTASITIEMLCYDKDNNRLSGNNAVVIDSVSGGQSLSGWRRVEHTFTAQPGAVWCHLRMFMNEYRFASGSNTAYCWICEPIVVEGDTAIPWCPSSNEIYDGITTIDKNGVTVRMSNGEGTQGYTTLAHDGMEIFNSRSQRVAYFGDESSAYIPTLTADNIYCPRILKWNQGRPSNLYCSPGGSGDGSGRDTNNKSNSIEGALNWLWNQHGVYSFKQDIHIYLDGGDYWSSSNYIGGWIGTGVIWLHFSPWAALRSMLTIEENTMPVIIEGTVDSENWNTQNNAYIITNSDAIKIRNSNVLIRGLNLKKPDWSGDTATWNGYSHSAINAQFGSRVDVRNVDMVGFDYGFYTHYGSLMFAYNCRGHVKNHGAAGGSIIAFEGYEPLRQNNCAVWNAGKMLGGSGSKSNSWFDAKPDVPYTPPPAPTENWQWVTGTFNATSLWTTPEGSGSSTSARTGSWGQGKWSSYKPHRGYASFSGISSWCSGGRNFSATLTMTRLNTSHGIAGATPVPKIKNTDGSFWNSGVAFARGDRKTITLPSTVANALANGSWTQLEMWAGTSTDDYSFYDTVSITIKCEKNMA